MRRMALSSVLVLACALVGLAAPAPAGAGTLNVGTLRGTVTDNNPDCYPCSLIFPHGCFVAISTGSDPVTVHLGLGTGDADCNSLAVDDCIEVTGEVVNELVAIPAVGSCQLEATMWRSVNTCS